MMADHTATLMTLAEVAATFAGFAALVTLFARKRLQGNAAHDLMRLRLVIGASVAVVMASLVPVAVAGFGTSLEMVWKSSTLVFLALIYFVIGGFLSSYKSVRGAFPPDRLAVTVAFGLEVLIHAGLITIVIGQAENRHFGIYVATLIGTLGQAAFIFLRLVESSFSSMASRTDRAFGTV
jgi:hypothetical protein